MYLRSACSKPLSNEDFRKLLMTPKSSGGSTTAPVKEAPVQPYVPRKFSSLQVKLLRVFQGRNMGVIFLAVVEPQRSTGEQRMKRMPQQNEEKRKGFPADLSFHLSFCFCLFYEEPHNVPIYCQFQLLCKAQKTRRTERTGTGREIQGQGEARNSIPWDLLRQLFV